MVRRTLEVKNKPQASRQQSVVSVPQTTIPSGPIRDCIRLRGLPFESKVEHVLKFLGNYAKHIAYHGVHMVYNHLVSFYLFNYFPILCHPDLKNS